MDTNTTTTNGAAAPSAQANANTSNGSAVTANQAEQDMLYNLKSAIDSNGRYKYKLNDLTTGYAAGRNMPTASAKAAIEDKFSNQFGMSPQQYLENHYTQRRETGRGR